MDPQQNMPSINLPSLGDNKISSQSQYNQPTPVNQRVKQGADTASGIAGNNQQISAPSMADDVDLIEKEWVNKAKEIINKTNNDPYERSRQLTLLKSEYLQKRYNKLIKIA